MKKSSLFLGLALLLAGANLVTAALSFTQLDLNGNYRMSSSGSIAGFPLGNQTYLGGVPFTQNDQQGQVWNGAYLSDGVTQSGSSVRSTFIGCPSAGWRRAAS